jgi:hypothetical protein
LFLHTQRQQEQQRVEKERQRKLQEANEAKKQAQLRQEDLVNKDKIVQEQATLVDMPRKPTKPAPYNKAEKEAEVRKKVQEMQRIRNEQKKVSNLMYRMYNTYIMPYPMTQYHTLYHSIPIGRPLCPDIVHFHLACLRSEIFLRELTFSSTLSSNRFVLHPR